MDKWIEYTGVAFSLLYVLLASKENKWCWVAGGLGAALYVYLNFKQQLIYDAGLQVYYVAVSVYGIMLWNKHPSQSRLSITSISPVLLKQLLLAGCVLTAVFGAIAHFLLLQPTAFLDAGVTAFSFIATWMTARKYIESWLMWVVIDIAAAVMYSFKMMYPTTALYIIFSALAVYGFLQWNKKMKQAEVMIKHT